MHFTTNSGLVGILASGAIKSRKRLPADKYVERVFTPNVDVRRDRAYLDYVNLSIASINGEFFDICSRKWHAGEDLWWCVLSLDSALITDEGVLFATTNNMYTGVERGSGKAGFETLFSSEIRRWHGNNVLRPVDLDAQFTTCAQAEVLYPGQVATSALREIYVSTPEDSDVVAANLSIFHREDVGIIVDPQFASVSRS